MTHQVFSLTQTIGHLGSFQLLLLLMIKQFHTYSHEYFLSNTQNICYNPEYVRMNE